LKIKLKPIYQTYRANTYGQKYGVSIFVSHGINFRSWDYEFQWLG